MKLSSKLCTVSRRTCILRSTRRRCALADALELKEDCGLVIIQAGFTVKQQDLRWTIGP